MKKKQRRKKNLQQQEKRNKGSVSDVHLFISTLFIFVLLMHILFVFTLAIVVARK